MTVKGVDYSHYQGNPDVAAMQRDGIQFVILKAWEADNHDPEYKTNLANARQHNMPVLAYVWLHASDTHTRMQHCFDYLDGAVIALDWEQDGVPASIVEQWMDAYETYAGRQGLCYYGLYPPDNPTPRLGEWPRWFPEYCSTSQLKLQPWDGSPAPDWRHCWAIWQYSESGHVAGVEGSDCDLDQLAPTITLDDFKSWLNDGTPLPHRVDVVRPAIRLLQLALDHMGYDAGPPDGLWGPHTQQAVEDYSGWKP